MNADISHLWATGTGSQQVSGEPGGVHIRIAMRKAEVNSYPQAQDALG